MESVHDQKTEPIYNEEEDQISSQHKEVMGVDEESVHVVKNDDSDGHVNWTWKQIVATVSLCGVYVGKFLSPPYRRCKDSVEGFLRWRGCDLRLTKIHFVGGTGSQIPLYFVGGE